jgi:hypothetical protein
VFLNISGIEDDLKFSSEHTMSTKSTKNEVNTATSNQKKADTKPKSLFDDIDDSALLG